MNIMKENKKINSIVKAFKIIELISNEKKGIKLNQIANTLLINPSTIHHILFTLLEMGLLVKNKKIYFLGPRLLEYANNYLNHTPVYQSLLPHIQTLSEKFNENISIILCESPNPILIDRFVSSSMIRPSNYYPTPNEMHASAWGKLLLSTFSNEELLEYISVYNLTQFTKNTITNIKKLLIELKKIKKEGLD